MGLSLPNARAMLGRCRAKAFGAKRALNPKETRLVNLLEQAAPEPVFTPDQLVKGLAQTLCESGLIDLAQTDGLDTVTDLISIFAAAQMHGCLIRHPDGSVTPLSGSGMELSNVEVWAGISGSDWAGQHFMIQVLLFDTGAPSTRYCDNSLHTGAVWAVPVELRDDWVLKQCS